MLTENLFVFHISNVLKDSNYSLAQFEDTAIEAFNATIVLKEVKGNPVPYVRCLVRAKEIKLTPEEVVRQLFVQKLITHYGYPAARMVLEYR